MPASAGLWIAAAILVFAWLALLVVVTRRQPLLLAMGFMPAAVSLIAVAAHNRPQLWAGIAAMSLLGSRRLEPACTGRWRMCYDAWFKAIKP